MKEKIKKIPVVVLLRQARKNYNLTRNSYHRQCQNRAGEEGSLPHYFVKNFMKSKVYFRKSLQNNIFNLIEDADISTEITTFFYNIDTNKTVEASGSLIHNFTVDYTFLLEHSINDIGELGDGEAKQFSNVLSAYIDRAIRGIEADNAADAVPVIESLSNMKIVPAQGFFDALQRILFVNQLMWQTGHRLNGLGRLDKILAPYYEADIRNGVINKDEAYSLIMSFLGVLHRYYWFKSNMLMGDTGQVIILGGKCADGSYFSNDLTEMFLLACKERKQPDPKILLRVCGNTPLNVLALATDVISTGIGSPLISNDDMVIPAMLGYGYDECDAYEYTVSACWEPTVAGQSAEVNNCLRLNFLEPLVSVLGKNCDSISNYEMFEAEYLRELSRTVDEMVDKANRINYECDICLMVFSKNTADNQILSKPKYMSYGFTGTAFPNVINSLINIRTFVFENHSFSLEDMKNILASDYQNREDVRKLLLEAAKFGQNDDEVISMCNRLVNCVADTLRGKVNKWGGHFKFGLSSPNYIADCPDFPATPDGRKTGEPFGVHISSIRPVPVTELLGFASKLDYLKAFNGNVVDFIVSPALMENNRDKFVGLLSTAIKIGVFQIQMNVVSSKTLIEAREHPEEFPDLVVRVWGFSAYFKDLPDEYKDLLIQRALESEKAA